MKDAESNPTRIFWIGDEARKARHKSARHTEIMPCNRRKFSKKDAVITYSHDDECFYVADGKEHKNSIVGTKS